jgi:hypothetical protein
MLLTAYVSRIMRLAVDPRRDCNPNGIRGRLCFELPHHVTSMDLHRPWTDPQVLGYALVRPAKDNTTQNLVFAVAKGADQISCRLYGVKNAAPFLSFDEKSIKDPVEISRH